MNVSKYANYRVALHNIKKGGEWGEFRKAKQIREAFLGNNIMENIFWVELDREKKGRNMTSDKGKYEMSLQNCKKLICYYQIP